MKKIEYANGVLVHGVLRPVLRAFEKHMHFEFD